MKKATLKLTTDGDVTLTSIVALNIASALRQHGVKVRVKEGGKVIITDKDRIFPTQVSLPDLEVTIEV